MILYFTYCVLLSVFLLNIGSYLDFSFSAIGVGIGARTAVVGIAALGIVGLIVISRGIHKLVWRELLMALAVWGPFLFYLALRVDSSNSYSELKFVKIISISFLCVATITVAYLCDARAFLRMLPIVIIIFSVLLGVEALLHPQQFRYRSVIERMTVEGMNPIWLARDFALAGVCLFLLPVKKNLVKLVGLAFVVIGILPTGSRGPLISLIVTLTVWFVTQSDRARGRLMAAVVCASILAVGGLLFAEDRIESIINSYFSRGQNQGLLEESGRPQLFRIAMDEFLSSPVVGVGLGAYGKSIISSSMSHTIQSGKGNYPHNIILEILAELGVLGWILASIAMRPGRWMFNMRNPYFYPFVLTLLYSMSSGDINTNTGVFIFGTLARLTTQYPVMEEIPFNAELTGEGSPT